MQSIEEDFTTYSAAMEKQACSPGKASVASQPESTSMRASPGKSSQASSESWTVADFIDPGQLPASPHQENDAQGGLSPQQQHGPDSQSTVAFDGSPCLTSGLTQDMEHFSIHSPSPQKHVAEAVVPQVTKQLTEDKLLTPPVKRRRLETPERPCKKRQRLADLDSPVREPDAHDKPAAIRRLPDRLQPMQPLKTSAEGVKTSSPTGDVK